MDHQSHTHAAAADHGSMQSYTVGFALSLGLTLASFGAVMSGAIPPQLRLAAIVLLAVAQLLVQLVWFLHLGPRPGQRSSSAIFLCTVGVIAIVVAGSLWVMHNANINMMPTGMSVEHAKSRE
jgi:cytochrome o ubiquinol oxidase operon protein cyoD